MTSQPLGHALASVLMGLILWTSCSPAPDPGEGDAGPEAGDTAAPAPTEVKQYTLRGQVLGLNEEDRTAVITHEEIEGYMDGMTMPFPVPDDADWNKLSPMDEIQGTLFVGEEGSYLGEIEVLPVEAASEGGSG